MTTRLPIPGADDNTWGDILNQFLSTAHNSDGSLSTSAVRVAGALLTQNNLADVSSSSQARANLGLGPLATSDGTAGGDLSGSYPNPTVNKINGQTAAAVATSGSYTDLSNQPIIPTRATPTVAGTLLETEYNPRDYGAKGDGQNVYDGAIATGTSVLTSASGLFKSTDVGKSISVVGASSTTYALATTIQSYTNATTVVLAANATQTASAKLVTWGTDDYAALQEMFNTTPSCGAKYGFGTGIFLTSQPIFSSTPNVQIDGIGWSITQPKITNNVMTGTPLTSIQPMAGFPSNSFALTLNNTTNMLIGNSVTNIAFFGGATQYGTNIGAIHYGNAAFCHNERFTIFGFSGDGVLIDQANYAYSVPSTSQMWFNTLAIQNCGGHGIHLGDGIFFSELYVSDFYIVSTNDGIHTGTGTASFSIYIHDGMTSLTNGNGITAQTYDTHIHDVTIYQTYKHGIYVKNTEPYGYQSSIHNVIVRDSDKDLNGYADIYIDHGSYGYVLEGNICAKVNSGSGEKGIVLVDGQGVNGNYVMPGNISTGHSVSNFDFAGTTTMDTRYVNFITNVTLGDGVNIPVGSSSGTRIGTATTQKLGFFNATPVAQQTADILTALSNLGLVATPTLSASDLPNLTGPITSTAGVTSIASQTGTGTAFAMSVGPTFSTDTTITSGHIRLDNTQGVRIKDTGGSYQDVLYQDGSNNYHAGNASTSGNSYYGNNSSSNAGTVYIQTKGTAAVTVNSTQQTGFGGVGPTSTVTTGGSFSTPIVAKSSSYTASATDSTILVSGTTTITLPTAAGITGRQYTIKKTDTGTTLTIITSSSQTIDGATSLAMATQYEAITVQSDGSNWWVINQVATTIL